MKEKYICKCSNDAFRIFPDFIECAGCGQKYDDSSQPTPVEFNSYRDSYYYQEQENIIYETSESPRQQKYGEITNE